MKTKTNRLLSLLLTLTMVLGMLPAMSLTAFAAEPGISITGSTADSSGTGWSYVESTKTLTLSGYNGGYIQGSGLNTLNLVLEGTSTITVDDANAKGIALGNNQNLNISGSGSLTINATGGSNLIYGIECNKFTMTSGTVTINANSSKMVYGVNANSSLSVTGGKLTANITGTSDGRGLYCKTGKLTVGSGAEVDVTVTNNGSNNMYGIYNQAYTASVTDNGDIELAGTVTITRDSGSTGSGIVYGIASGGSGGNTDGVISITGGSVTVTNANYGIIAFTKGHDAAFADVDISGGTVNVTSTTSDSLGIVSWNNGVTISGGTVTAGTANKALWLVDSDSANKTGLVKITGDAKVSLTSTDYKALIVQGDESNTSTRVHQINLTSGGSVTVKSTSSEESYYAFPVQGYFNLGSSTKITEGSLRSTADGINAGGGKLFQSDNSTKQVVVAYSTLYTGAGAVSVNGHSFASDKLYYKNGGADTTDDSTDYNAHYDPATGVLELKDYNSGPIIIGGSNAYDLTVKLTGTNTVTTSAPIGGVGNVCVGINITNADNVTFIGDGTLTVNTNAGSGLTQVFGIWLDRSAAAAENLTFQSGKVTVNVTATDTAAQVFGVSTAKSTMGGPITVAEGAELNVTLSSASTGLANGLLSKGNITLNGKTAITLTYTGSGSPNASNWSSVSGFLVGNKLNVGANAAITVDMPDTYSLTNGMSSAYYAAKSDSQIGDEDWTNAAGSEQYFENDSFLVTQSVQSGLGYADYKYEVITPLTFEDKADYDIPAGTKGTGYTATVALTATGGSGEYRYEFEGTKPSDLSINAENKLVYTRSSLCDATTATVKVTDKGGISKSITIDIGAVTEGGTAPGANSVSVNGHNFASPTKLYYKNDGTDTTNDSTDYNAYYNPATGVLELKNYNSGRIIIGGSVESDITIKLVGDNVINSDSQFGIVNNNGGDITITAGSDATLIINVTNDSNNAYGIACDIPGSYASRSRAITISGKANVTVNATATSTEYNKKAVGISTMGTVAIKDDASFKAVCKSSTPSTGLQSAAGIYGGSGVTINTTGKVDIDISQCSGAYNYGIYGNASNNLTKVGEMTIKWKQSSGNGAHVLAVGSFDSAAATHAINVDTTNCVATYRYGTPYTVTVNNGSCDAANRQYLEGDTVTVTANTISGITFKKWSSADVTVASETSAATTFTMPAKAVTVTANYNLFTTEPSFARTSDTEGTISFTLAADPSGMPKLVEKDSDTVVGNQYFSGSTLERSNTVTDGTGTYNVPSGEYRIAVQYGGVWFYSDVFAVNYAAGVTKLDKPTNLVWDGTTAKWDAVTGANNYKVILRASEREISGDYAYISNTDITNKSMDYAVYMLPGMYYYFEVAAYNSANQSETFSDYAYSDKKQMPGSIGTVTGFAWSGNTISWTAVTGATGYDVWVMKDGVQKGSVRNISTASFDLTSDFESGGEGTYYVIVSAYKLARGNYLAKGNSPAKIIGATPIYSAAVRNVSVNGTIGTAITETQVVIDLTNDTFVSALSGNWITNLPAGLSQSVSYGGTTMAIITISGTPTAASTEQIAITIPADQLIVNTEDLTVTANADAKFNISAPTYTVTINAGANMTLASGNANQSGLSGAMTDTVYTAADGYYFPTDYTVAAVNGITVARIDFTQIKVSGTPTAAANITLTAPTAKTKEATPTAVFTANGTDSGKLTGIAAGMKYRIGGGAWVDIMATEANLTGLSACTITIMKSGNGTTTLDSDEQTITVTKAAKPALTPTLLTLTGGKGSIPTTAAHEFSTDGAAWTPCTGATENLDTGKYYVRVKANGTQLASETQEIDIFLYGDANGDGKVDIDDLTRLRRYIAESSTVIFPGADANGDGTVDIDDLTRLRRYVAEEAVVLGK